MPNSFEKAASKTMGTVKSAQASLKGLTGVFKHLMQEHGEVSALIKRVTASSDSDVRRELYPTIREELLGHEKGELNAVYPVLAEYPETEPIAARHAREASELEAAIRAVDAVDFGAQAWEPAFEHLAALVKAHVDEEENEFFPAAQETIGEERARGLTARFEAAKTAATVDLH
jgi:thioredoxin-like negative regulator of GroEL